MLHFEDFVPGESARSRGIPHSHVHAELRRQAGGPPLSRASTDQVDARIRLIKKWHTGK